MNPESAPQAWRFQRESLRPQTENPGLFKRMHERQKRIKATPKVESNFHKYQAEGEELPRTRE